ncbi:hypothetical protein SAY87_009572 [Trapa incisa]|uniref:Uncharacterized protein n=1 Tax=Trapa incisa TaxID=236973 RepID=A0AAN7K177_9MYRT|nr:hypothetical protein SAY87_009572 [Trapa incisa]
MSSSSKHLPLLLFAVVLLTTTAIIDAHEHHHHDHDHGHYEPPHKHHPSKVLLEYMGDHCPEQEPPLMHERPYGHCMPSPQHGPPLHHEEMPPKGRGGQELPYEHKPPHGHMLVETTMAHPPACPCPICKSHQQPGQGMVEEVKVAYKPPRKMEPSAIP